MNRTHWTSSTLLVIAIPLAGCAGPTPGARPDDMSAEEHRQEAGSHDTEAATHGDRYDPSATAVRGTGASVGGGEFAFDEVVYNPTRGHLREQEEHQRHAADHRAAAEALETYEESRCGDFPPSTRAACPLLGHIEAAEDIEGGIRVRFAEDVNIEAVRAHVQCHIAFARTRGQEGMASCPLYVESVQASASGDRGLDLTVEGSTRVGALRQRTRTHVID